jgi:16S rRNA (guanine966-N2)-methyltransferase
MRITGGLAKGRLLAPPRGLDIRPTSDRVREAIFSLIGQDMTSLRVMDLFAGTGSLGIEALSRGAQWVLFIDRSRHSIRLIRKNLASCGYEKKGFVYKKDLSKGLAYKHALMKERMDLVFVDPPYGKELIPPVLRELSEKKILASPSLVVAESSKFERLPTTLGKIRLVNSRIYGETKIDICHYEDDE